MTLTPVDSSQVAAIGYNAESQTLRVEFKPRKTETKGQVYEYQNVPAKLHADLMKAESKGAFLSKHILRNKAHPCKKL